MFQINFFYISSNHLLPYEVKPFIRIGQRKEDFKVKIAELPKKEFWKKNFRQTAFCFYIVSQYENVTKSSGGTDHDRPNAIQQTSDVGYFVARETFSFTVVLMTCGY